VGVDDTDAESLVGARNDDDRILGIAVDADESATGGCVDVGHEGRDSFGDHETVEGVPGMIRAEAGDERCIGAGPRRGDRLIESLAAGVLGVLRAEHGFARTRQSLDGGHEVEVAAADDHHVVRVRTSAHGSIEPAHSAPEQPGRFMGR
jgi:hypothetical protein